MEDYRREGRPGKGLGGNNLAWLAGLLGAKRVGGRLLGKGLIIGVGLDPKNQDFGF